jgi:hypothetical protein
VAAVAPTVTMAAAEAGSVATVMADRVVVVMGIAVGAGRVVEPEGERAPAGLQRLALGLRESGDEAVEAEAPADDLNRVAIRRDFFGALDRFRFVVVHLLPVTFVSEDVAGHPERVGAAGAAV